MIMSCSGLMLAAAAVAVIAALTVLPEAGAAVQPLSAEQIAAVAAMLPDKPDSPGPDISVRTAWDKLVADPAAAATIKSAEALIKEPIPDQPDSLFLEFSRTGNRTHWQDVAFRRRGRLVTLVLAECLEDRGRFIPGIEAIVKALCAEPTWELPAHDGKLDNFYGKTIDIDLGSSALGWNMALTLSLLGDKLSPQIQDLIHNNVERRIIVPFRDMVEGKRPLNWWMVGTNNWNAVCLAGVVGAALAEVPSREERAEFVVAGEQYSRYFLKGFTPDGYCSEGLGYWGYGFGHYVLLSETIRRATHGGVDLLARPEAKMPALFAARIQIMNGVAPAYADCSVNARPPATTMHLLNDCFNLGLKQYADPSIAGARGSLYEAMIYFFPDSKMPVLNPTPSASSPGSGLIDWFDRAGILIARPAAGSACQLGVAMKGGNNAENHNHNDVGSYVVVCEDRPVIVDPGPETYTARTFSSHRYDSKLLNSFGHDVPMVAGQLQRAGAEAVGKVVSTDFTPDTDSLKIDITSAYAVPELKSLLRSWAYSRLGAGSLTVTDQVEFTTPEKFGTALITLDGWKKQNDGSLLVWDVDRAVRVRIDTGGLDYTLDPEVIHENAPVTPTRIGINLDKPVTTAVIKLQIEPYDLLAGGALIPNGDFELGSLGWDLPANGMGSVSTEQAANGKASLKISDDSTTAGSNITSGRIHARPGAAYTLSGKIYLVSGTAPGLYMRFYDANRQSLNVQDAHGNTAPVGIPTGAPGKWEPFNFRFNTPAGTATMDLWIHSFNGALTQAYLDDLAMTPGKP